MKIEQIRPEVALSFYRITRVGRDTLSVLDQFTQMSTETAQEPVAGIDDDVD